VSNHDLRNADLSSLRVNDMTTEQKTELRRRYQEFLRHVMKKGSATAGASPGPAPAPPKHTKWVPSKVIRKPL